MAETGTDGVNDNLSMAQIIVTSRVITAKIEDDGEGSRQRGYV